MRSLDHTPNLPKLESPGNWPMTISNFFCLYTDISCINLCHILFTHLFLHPHSVGYFSKKKKKEGAKIYLLIEFTHALSYSQFWCTNQCFPISNLAQFLDPFLSLSIYLTRIYRILLTHVLDHRFKVVQ